MLYITSLVPVCIIPGCLYLLTAFMHLPLPSGNHRSYQFFFFMTLFVYLILKYNLPTTLCLFCVIIYFRYVILRWINALHKFSPRSFTSMIGIAMNLQITLRETNVIILSLSIYEYCVSISCSCSVAKWCPTLCNPMDYSPPGPSVPGISQARIL